MATNPPEIFTLTFWQTTAARVVHYGSVLALGAWGIGAVPSASVSVPAWGVAIGGGAGALYGLLVSLAGASVEATAERPLAALFPRPNQVLEMSLHDRGA